jgi:Fe-S-cluster containining protein
MVINTADCKTYFLRWAKHGEEDIVGKMIPPARTFDRGYCILFDLSEKSCLIHPVRPQEASAIK